MGLSNKGKSFWYTVIMTMVIVAVLVILVFVPIFSIPLTDDPTGTSIKRSLYEHLLLEHFDVEL